VVGKININTNSRRNKNKSRYKLKPRNRIIVFYPSVYNNLCMITKKQHTFAVRSDTQQPWCSMNITKLHGI